MTAERVRYWKDRFDESYRAGDKAGMVEAEKNLEAWRMWDALKAEEQEQVLHKNREARRA